MSEQVWQAPRLRAVFTFAGLGLAVVLAWILRSELVLLFASVLFAISLYASGQWLAGRTGISGRSAIIAWYFSGVLLALLLGGFIGMRVTSQYESLTDRVPAAIEKVERRLTDVPILGSVATELEDIRTSISGGDGQADAGAEAQDQRMRIMRLSLRGLSAFFLWAALVFYFAIDGQRYVRIFRRLIPSEHRGVGDDLVKALGTALPYWLIGRLASMLVVSILVGVGLGLLGIPVAFTLAVIAGLFSFVPFLGPVASVIPAVLVTLDAAPDKLLWVLLVYLATQFLESYFITPHIQQRAVSVLPAALIAAQLIAGTLLGLVGVMFSTPLLLTMMVVVQVVYLKHGLGEAIRPPNPDG